MKFRRKTLELLGDLVVGNPGFDPPGPNQAPRYFPYRSSMYISEFFEELGTDRRRDGTTRNWCVANVIEEMLAEPHDGPTPSTGGFLPPDRPAEDPNEAKNEGPDRPTALQQLNARRCLWRYAFVAPWHSHGVGFEFTQRSWFLLRSVQWASRRAPGYEFAYLGRWVVCECVQGCTRFRVRVRLG